MKAAFWIVCFFVIAPAMPAQQRLDYERDCAAISHRSTAYKVQRKSAGLLQVSVPSRSAAEGEKAAELGCQLLQDYAGQGAVALIFDEAQSARNLAPLLQDQVNHGKYLDHLRARFEADAGGTAFIEYWVRTLDATNYSLKLVSIHIALLGRHR